MKTGRNDPCPCGSGKKYKQCCLQAQQSQQTEDFLWHQIRRVIDGLPVKLLKFSQNHWGEGAFLEAWGDFTLWREEEFSQDTPHMQLFMPWFFFNWHPDYSIPDTDTPRNKTTGEAFLDKHGTQLDPLLKRSARPQSRARIETSMKRSAASATHCSARPHEWNQKIFSALNQIRGRQTLTQLRPTFHCQNIML